MDVRYKRAEDEGWLRDVLEREWGGTTMVVHEEEFALLELPTLIAGERDGIAIVRDGEPAELVLLEALAKGRGVGSALLDAVSRRLRERGTTALCVTTTNDNLEALSFYQKQGFRLRALRPGAVAAARRRKPTIPLVAENGIPISDELDLELALT